MNNPFMPTTMSQTQSFEQAFMQFKQTFRGDPQQEIQRMLQTGQISQNHVNAAFQKARQMGLIR